MADSSTQDRNQLIVIGLINSGFLALIAVILLHSSGLLRLHFPHGTSSRPPAGPTIFTALTNENVVEASRLASRNASSSNTDQPHDPAKRRQQVTNI